MAYSALLTIEDLGESYYDVKVYHCTFEFTQKIDIQTGHTLSNVQAGLIQIVVESEKTTSLLDWMIKREKKDGFIQFKAATGKGTENSKKLTFYKAKCVDYRETFEAMTGNAMLCHFSIWCQKIEVGNSTYEVSWEETDTWGG
ncbi:type VI secretion system tube protein TssD [Eudoraea adriatica]|uniref:type VI secretion system tube protein TssD n=1 Tax=Eudoraea adriatica TaxID=446681 RepID=UPI00035E00E1|nr:type VI secretion system tube protein TssD [Eudoraea adriatica]